VGLSICEVDESAARIEVLERMDERKLPAREQRDCEKDPCYAGAHLSWTERRR